MRRQAHNQFLAIVLKGAREDKGMASFASQLTERQAKDSHGYLVTRAQDDW